MKASRIPVIVFSIALASIVPPQEVTLAAPGDPDSTFNSDGWIRAGLGPTGNVGTSAVAQPDLKVVVAGYCSNGDNYDFTLFRYNTDGSLDPTFGEGGKVITSISFQNDYANCVTIQADEKIVVGGEARSQFALARYNPDGTLDESFGDGGRAVAGGYDGVGNAITLQPDGKIVIAGFTYDGAATHIAVARFLPDGTLDPQFGGGIVATTNFIWSRAEAVAYHPDGGLVVAGRAGFGGGTEYIVVARYTDSGLLDTSFDSDGLAVVAAGSTGIAAAYAVAVQTSLTSAPKIVVAGSAQNVNGFDFAIIRLGNDGILDNTFGSGGTVTTDFYGGYDQIESVWIQYSGVTPNKIVVAGFAAQSGNYDFAVARYSIDGTPDGTFDGDGRTSADFLGGADDVAYGMIRTAGRILLAGYANQPGTSLYCALARFNDDGTLDTTFDLDGRRLDLAGNRSSEAGASLIQPDGKIVVAGVMNSTIVGYRDFALFRCNPDGTPDPSFNGNGWSSVIVGNQNTALTGLARQADGKLVAAGYVPVGSDTNMVLLRLNANGTVDGTFGAGGLLFTRVGGMNVRVEDVAIQNDGKILVAGSSANVMVVARFDAAGALDATFGASGFTTIAVGDGAFAKAMALHADGRIVLAGGCLVGTDTDVAVVRLTANGSLDLSFAGNGRVITTLSSNADLATDVIVIHGDRILITGESDWTDLMLVRYNPDGSLDATFDGDGYSATEMFGYAGAVSVAIQPNSRIVVAGKKYTSPTDYFDFALTRFERNGAVDTAYGDSGTVHLDLGGGLEDSPAAVVIDAEGKAVIAGTSGGLFAIARFHGEGVVTAVGDVERSAGPAPGLFVGAPQPNPTRAGTTVRFRTSAAGPLTAEIVDVTGRVVRRLIDAEPRGPGEHVARWDGRDDSGTTAASGAYFMRLRHGSFVAAEKIVLLH
jgi:uncharacterized delta-60 repeat protein